MFVHERYCYLRDGMTEAAAAKEFNIVGDVLTYTAEELYNQIKLRDVLLKEATEKNAVYCRDYMELREAIDPSVATGWAHAKVVQRLKELNATPLENRRLKETVETLHREADELWRAVFPNGAIPPQHKDRVAQLGQWAKEVMDLNNVCGKYNDLLYRIADADGSIPRLESGRTFPRYKAKRSTEADELYAAIFPVGRGTTVHSERVANAKFWHAQRSLAMKQRNEWEPVLNELCVAGVLRKLKRDTDLWTYERLPLEEAGLTPIDSPHERMKLGAIEWKLAEENYNYRESVVTFVYVPQQ